MHEFIYTATDSTGKRSTNRIEAASTQEARREIEAAGFDTIVFHTDDFDAVISDMVPDKLPVDDILTASEEAQIQHFSDLRLFFFMLKKFCWYLRWLLLLAITLLSFSLTEPNSTIGIKFVLSLLLFLVPVWLALKASYFSPSQKYKQMLEAFTYGRWNEVLESLPEFKKYRPPFELSGRQGCALAALGRLDEGLEIIEPFSDSPEVPRWMYYTQLADLYDYAHEGDRSLDYRLQAYQHAPENSSVLLGYADSLLKQNKDPQLTQKLIHEAEQQQLSDMSDISLQFTKGLLELNSGQPRLAFYLFAETQKMTATLHAISTCSSFNF